jgi:LysM repeat protein
MAPAVDEGTPVTSPATWLRRLTATTTAGGMLLLGAPVVVAYAGATSPTSGRSHHTTSAVSPGIALAAHRVRGHKHPGRRIVHYKVRPGDTATGLAVRFHAWTDELLKMNHLGPHARLYAGERIRIPVVVAAARKAHRHHHKAPRHHHKARHPHKRHHSLPSRARVRRVVIGTAQRHDVGVNLALAIAWQESGWQMGRLSPARAAGVMQVLPSTGRWMSQMVGRRLHIHKLHDNVTAGVVLIKVLQNTAPRKKAIAGYYQGLGSVLAFGMYDGTKAYVANVLALRRHLVRGWNPA